MTAHSSVIGGSTAARVMACPGSIDLVARAPVRPSSAAAEEGTALHMAMELYLDPTRRDTLQDAPILNGYAITPDLMDECVLPAAEAVTMFLYSLGDVLVDFEQRAAFPGLPDAFGTADLVFRSPGPDGRPILRGIGDYKFGRIWTAAETQLKFYLCALRAAYGGRAEYPLRTIVIQPRCNNYTTAEYSKADLDAFEVEVHHAVNGERPLRPGDEQCRYCPAAAFCPALEAQARRALSAAEREPAKMAARLVLAQELQHWIDAVREEVRLTIMGGTPVPGFKMVEGKRTRAWADVGIAEMLFRSVGADPYSHTLKTVAEAERLGVRRDMPDGVIRTGRQAPRLVREEDAGEALSFLQGGAPAGFGAAQKLPGLPE